MKKNSFPYRWPGKFLDSNYQQNTKGSKIFGRYRESLGSTRFFVFIEALRVWKRGTVTSCNCGWSILDVNVAQHVGSSAATSNYASPDINHRKYEAHWRNPSIDALLPLWESSGCILLKRKKGKMHAFKMSTRNARYIAQCPESFLSLSLSLSREKYRSYTCI